MRKINKNSRRGIVNLFADFILSRIDKKENSIIEVIDCESFMVIKGNTTSNKLLDLDKIKLDFINQFSEILKTSGFEKINTLDIINYNQEIDNIESGWVSVNKKIFIDESEPIKLLSVSSEFPYGYSLNCGRLMVYYSHYIFNHMYSLLGLKNLKFYFTKEEDENGDFKIKIVSDSKINEKRIKSLILDVFSFDLKEFNTKMDNYNLLDDILSESEEKPYTKQDMLKHIILF